MPETTVVPALAKEWSEKASEWFESSFTDKRCAVIRREISQAFKIGLWEGQKTRSRTWIGTSLKPRLNQAAVARMARKNAGTVSKWLSAQSDMSFAEFQLMYTQSEVEEEGDRPFLRRTVLNLHGYFTATMAAVELLAGRHFMRRKRVLATHPALETVLCLNSYFSMKTPDRPLGRSVQTGTAPSERAFRDVVREVREATRDVRAETFARQDVLKIIRTFQVPWLVCLTILAEEDGVEAMDEMVKRPISLVPDVQAAWGADGR